MTTTTRFAPSPTGYLHLGNARQAVVNGLAARAAGGRFFLRIDDTDRARSNPHFEQAIEEDLLWLNLPWDSKVRQSDRNSYYSSTFELLSSKGRVYACYETAEELEERRKKRLARGLPPVYDGAAKKLTPEEKQACERQGRQPHWRFALESEEIVFDDMVAGSKRFLRKNLGDPVIRRADGSFIYLFASAVDDVELGVSEIIRGQDHLSNTPIQIELTKAMGADLPRFAHLPLLVGAGGEKFSKRLGSQSVRDLRKEGADPLAIVQVLGSLGTATAPNSQDSFEEILERFDLKAFGNAAARLDVEDIRRLGAERLHLLSASEISKKVGDTVSPEFWEAIKSNIQTIEDVKTWCQIIQGNVEPTIVDGAYLRQAAELLPANMSDYDSWIADLKRVTGRKGKALFHPLRLALTGRSHGPELRVLLPLLGRERAVHRLLGELG